MKWEGRCKWKATSNDILFKTGEVYDVLAIINNDEGMYDFKVYDIYSNGKLSEDYNKNREWVKSLTWAKRKCDELVPNRIGEWEWNQIK